MDGFSEAEASTSFFDNGISRRKKQSFRTRQLCRQVWRTISCTLAGQCDDEILQDLAVDSVAPAPDASRLVVNVYPTTLGDCASVADILQRLSRVESFLRREVAAAIVRKRAPELIFNVVAAEGGEHEHP